MSNSNKLSSLICKQNSSFDDKNLKNLYNSFEANKPRELLLRNPHINTDGIGIDHLLNIIKLPLPYNFRENLLGSTVAVASTTAVNATVKTMV